MAGKWLLNAWYRNSESIKLVTMFGLILENHSKEHLETALHTGQVY